MGAVGFSFVAFLGSIHSAAGDSYCSYRNRLGEDDTMTCLNGCCGTYSNRKCCSLFTTSPYPRSSWSSWSSSVSTSVSTTFPTGAIIGIVVGVIILIASIVGIIQCVICCVKASSPTPTTPGALTRNTRVAVAGTQGAANYVYVPQPRQAAYPPQPQPQAAYPPQLQPQAAYPPSQAADPVPPPSKDASAPPSYESLYAEAKF